MRALKHIHGMNIMHRDIKPTNIRVSANNNLVLLDFGSAITNNISNNADKGTYLYMSRKRSNSKWYGLEEDLVGAGVTLFQLYMDDPTLYPWRIPTSEHPDGSRFDRITPDDMTLGVFLSMLNPKCSKFVAQNIYGMIFPESGQKTYDDINYHMFEPVGETFLNLRVL